MPDKIVRRSKIAEGLAALAVFIALTTSLAAYVANRDAINRNQDAIHQINDSRISLTYNACLDQNKRHRDSMAFLRRLGAEEIKKGKATKAQVKEGLKNEEFLFDALAPIKNCRKLVFERYGEAPTPTTAK